MLYTKKPPRFHPKFTIAFCICEHDKEILILQRQEGKGQAHEWGVPAGKIESSESPLQAVQRELFEETGIQQPQSKFIYINTFYDVYLGFEFVVEVFHVELSEQPQVILNPLEHENYCWVTPQKAVSMPHMLDVDLLLKSYYQTLKVT